MVSILPENHTHTEALHLYITFCGRSYEKYYWVRLHLNAYFYEIAEENLQTAELEGLKNIFEIKV